MGSKIFVDVTKYELGKCLEKIVRELVNVKKEIDAPNESRKRDSGHFADKSAEKKLKKQSSNGVNWSAERVEEWSRTLELSESVKQALFPCSGEILHQYYKIYKKTPDFFLRKLAQDSKCELSLKELATFLSQLEKLFE